jgi:hypothetical protein
LTLDDARLVHELAARTAQGVAGAVKAALAAEGRRVVDRGAVDAIMKRVSAAHVLGITSDHSELYGDDGLPL